MCMHTAATVSGAGTISSRFRSLAASAVAAAAHEPTHRVPRVRSGLGARDPRPRWSSRAGRAAAPGRPEGAAVPSPAVRRSVSAPRPSRASAGPSRRRRRRRRRRLAVPGSRRRTRSRAVSPPSGALRPLPRTARQEKGAHSARGFPTPAAWMVKAAGSHDGSIPPCVPRWAESPEVGGEFRTLADYRRFELTACCAA